MSHQRNAHTEKKHWDPFLEFDDVPWIAKTRVNRVIERRRRYIEREQAGYNERDSSASARDPLSAFELDQGPKALHKHVIQARTAEDAKSRANQEIIITFSTARVDLSFLHLSGDA